MYRKRVRHLTAENLQLDLFDPDDGYYECAAIVTDKAVTGRTACFFLSRCPMHWARLGTIGRIDNLVHRVLGTIERKGPAGPFLQLRPRTTQIH